MGIEPRPNSDYTRTWSPSGEIEYAKLADGTRLRYLKTGSGPMALILLHTVRTQLDQFQFVIPKIGHGFTLYAIDMPGMGWSDIMPGASYTEPALRRAIVEFVKTLDLRDVTLAGESMGATVSLSPFARPRAPASVPPEPVCRLGGAYGRQGIGTNRPDEPRATMSRPGRTAPRFRRLAGPPSAPRPATVVAS